MKKFVIASLALLLSFCSTAVFAAPSDYASLPDVSLGFGNLSAAGTVGDAVGK